MLIKQINPGKEEGANMDKNIIDLYDEYHHGTMDRREFLKKLSILAGSTAVANTLLPLLENNYANAEIVSPMMIPVLLWTILNIPVQQAICAPILQGQKET